ncbi:MAG: 23S rRNA (pseudouridine(1915)-N(3))-methyltransferase RlmH [Flavobacteriales bacterium]
MKLLQVGKTKERFTEEAIAYYQKRIRKYAELELITVPAAKGKRSQESHKQEEERRIRKELPKSPFLVLLDERGASMDSKTFAGELKKFREKAGKDLTFVIGGAYGVPPALSQEADRSIALSEMTFSHQVARIVFLEQLYRGLSILNGDPYHNER